MAMLKLRRLLLSNYFFIMLISVVAIVLLVLSYVQVNPLVIALVGIFSLLLSMTQQLLQQKKTDVADAEANLSERMMEGIRAKVTITTAELENKQKVMSHFLKHGIVKEQDLIETLNQQSFIILFHYNRQMDKDFLKFLPDNKKFSKLILDELGFVPVGAVYGSYFFHVISSTALPHPLDNIAYLEAYIRKRLVEYWTQLESNLEAYPHLLEKFRKKERKKGNLSYFLGKIFSSNLSIGFVNFSSFDTKFLEYSSRFVNSKNLEIDTQELKSLITLASIAFFIDSIEPIDRKVISQNESKIKNELKIESLFDYATIPNAEWQRVLSVYFNRVKTTNYSEIISSRARELCPIIKEFLQD